jgi:aspartate/tyrosine/aromatic aminotransferase
MGAYRDDAGKPYILPVVNTAERRIRELGMDHEYAPIDGIPRYRKGCIKLGWGDKIASENRVSAC